MENLEGQQSIIAAIQACQRRIDVILLAHGAHEEKFAELLTLAEARAIPVRRVARDELDAMAHGATHGGVIAVATPKQRMKVEALEELLTHQEEAPLLLLLEGVEDARNLGFVIRSAEALGVHAVLIKKHLWDLDSVEIARPASGAYERMPLVQIDSVAPLKRLQARGLKLYGCVAGAKRTLYDVPLHEPSILALGGEKRGLSGAVRDICDRFVTIPSRPGVSSLSLSHAGAIVMAEAMRQRRLPAGPRAQLPTAPDADSAAAAGSEE